MLTVLLYVLVIALLLLLVLIIFALTKPNDFVVSRSISIHAPRERVYRLVSDFREWPKWSPWERLDPAMRRTLSGADQGLGAIYEWDGNRKVGTGRMEITAVEPPSLTEIALTFIRPFAAQNQLRFTLVPAGDGTNVTWEMTGTNNLPMKVMAIVMNMDRIVGRDFERGLQALKAEAEKGEDPGRQPA
jgi:uncharacterized protein YndB with AHSA1/START domain